MRPTYKVIVIDDEPPARDLIKAFIELVPDVQCIYSCSNAIEGIQAIQDLKPDLLFLDIQMPELSGLELMQLPLAHRPEIILTTAYPEYALASYEFSVLDYLVKPIPLERFIKSIVKFREKIQLVHSFESGQLTTNIQPSLIVDSNSIWLREEKRLLQILYSDVLYIEGLKDYVKVQLNDQTIITHLSLGKAEKIFMPPKFVRVHRSFIVLLSAIRLIDGNNITLINGKQLVMGSHYREELKRHIGILT